MAVYKKTPGDFKSNGHRKATGAGAKKWEPTKEQRDMVRRMVGIGMTLAEVGKVLKKDRNTISLRCRDEIETAAIHANMTVIANLFKQTATNVRAAEFWLINRDPSRWKMRSYLEGGVTLAVPRPNLSGLSNEQLALLRSAAAVLRGTGGPVVEGESRQLEGPDDDEEPEGEDDE